MMIKTSAQGIAGTAVISGAAGGLGTELVKILLDNGFNVIAADLDQKRLSSLPDHERLTCRAVDVTGYEDVRSFAEELSVTGINVDTLVCAAGIYDTFPVTEANPGLFRKTMEVNLLGAVNMIQAFAGMLINSKGRVIVITSESYKVQAMFQPYMISKAALEAYCHSARQELGLKGVSLTVVRPGAINTPLLDWMKSGEFADRFPLYREELIKSWEKSLKMVGTISPPRRIAEVILKAASAKKPKMVYLVNNSKLLKFISLFPASFLDKMAIRMFRVKK
jgi:NAD(P)-dependent dehydrogenase (short-subunit alcohol dehydrogenase family)